jgi:hypothetical protein
LVWPPSEPVTYAEDVPHGVQEGLPALLEKVLAGQDKQTVLLVAEQPDEVWKPGAQTAHAAQGAIPEALKVEPPTQELGTHVLLALLHA